MKTTFRKLLTYLSPLLGAGAVGACPLCWIGSASLLTYLGLGVLIPVWQWIVLALLGLAVIGFAFDYWSHRNAYPLTLLLIGSTLLLYGRYGPYGGEGFAGWQVWAPGGLLIIAAIIYNKHLFSKKASRSHDVEKKEHITNN